VVNASLEVKSVSGTLQSKRFGVGYAALIENLGATSGVPKEQAETLRKEGHLDHLRPKSRSSAISLSRGAGQRSDWSHATHAWKLKRVMEITDENGASIDSEAHDNKAAIANAVS
jgi:hypothetical protein